MAPEYEPSLLELQESGDRRVWIPRLVSGVAALLIAGTLLAVDLAGVAS
jgi:hypothetical protein